MQESLPCYHFSVYYEYLMKVKQTPEDFVVREIGDTCLAKDGPHAIYRLSKKGIGTIEAINVINRVWHITRSDTSIGGLKDKHAGTEQFISIYRGPRRGFQHRLFHLEYLGQIDQPIRPQSIKANHFTICLRTLLKTK